ncbi:restriction endonuclease subunit S [Candidatus Poribacteria bacterium]|nr:MAG: restriction endonuclease subunit S [Candidatus Poribacteria bacterium]
MIDLNPKHFETVQHILAKHVPGYEVRAFGSRVKWTAKDYSDLDLAVVGSKPLTLRQTGQLAEAFEESNLPIRVDILDWHRISEEFKKIITEEYEVIQGPETVTANEESGTIPKNSATKNNRWDVVKLGDVVQINPRRTLPKKETAFHLAMQDVEGYRREITAHSSKEFRGSGARFQNGDTLLARITPCLENGKTVYVDCLKPNQIGHGSTEFIVLSGIEDKTDNLFVYYLARDPSLRTFAIHSMQGSTGRQRVDADSLRLFEFSLPPIEEQCRIAHILSTLDDKIELNRQMNETLEATARAIFKSWFVNFDPVKANVEGRKPPCMDAETAALFPSVLQDSRLGEVPEGWKVATIDEDFNLVMGQSPPGSTYNEDEEGMLFYQGRRDFGFRYPTQRVYCTAPKRFAGKGDTLVSVRAPVGDINMASEKCSIGRGVAAIRHKTRSRSYTYYTMQSLQEVFSRYEAEGTVFGSINKTDFQTLPCLRPPDEIVEVFERLVFPLDQTIENNENESRTLAHTRDTLLPKLLSGEIRVNEANEILERT